MLTPEFQDLLNDIPNIGKGHHEKTILEQAQRNKPNVINSLSKIPPLSGDKLKSCVVISAGPSVQRQNSIHKLLKHNYKGTTVATDGSYIACLKAGLFPDYVVTMDPHFSRVVRWFGDPNFEKHTENDDYYDRQDLDVEFRKNTIAQNKLNIALVNEHAHKTKAVVCTVSHPETVVHRLREANFPLYWWNPLVDDPTQDDSLTRKLYNINPVTCLNTGGTVGTASWVLASSFLNIPKIAVVGMDFGYYYDTTIQQTQTYYELIAQYGKDVDLQKYIVKFTYPLTGEKFFTDPTYYWYRQNFLELVGESKSRTYNCTDAGTLIDPRVENMFLENFLMNF